MKYTSKGPLSINELLKAREEKYNITKDKLLNELNQYSFEDVGKIYNVSSNSIRKWCDDYQISRHAKDYQNKEKDEKFSKKMSELNKINSTKKKKVLQIDKKSKKIIKEFDSLADAASELNVKYSNISRAIYHYDGRQTAYGYIWKYK